ncbi:MAG: DUF177 domain-containing protein [Rhodospirillales bacterium]|nr:DUF177 domain-containing protein [Rhodospirillales bacterium]
MDNPTSEFSRIIPLDSIGNKGTIKNITADKDERSLLAKRFNLLGLDSLTAEIRLTPKKGGRLIRLNGVLQAKVSQSCVVTLEALDFNIAGTLERLYDTIGGEDPETFETLSKDPPDPATKGVIDIGEAVAEQLGLEIDPFPRKQEIDFKGYSAGPKGGEVGGNDEKEENKPKSGPFAALEKLKKVSK